MRPPRRDGPLDAAVIENRTHPVAVAGQQPGQRGDEIDQHGPLQALGGAKIHRRAEIEQEPGRDFTVFDILADVGRVHPGGDIPIDVANVVFGLIFAQVGKIHPVAVEQAAVVALKQAIQPADDLPVEALEDAFRR